MADYHQKDVQKILDLVIAEADQQQMQEMPTRVWNERFYLPLIPAIFLIMYLFGRGNRFARKSS